jgi:hypothetical protein
MDFFSYNYLFVFVLDRVLYAVQDDLEPSILLFQPPKVWDYRCELSHLAPHCSLICISLIANDNNAY